MSEPQKSPSSLEALRESYHLGEVFDRSKTDPKALINEIHALDTEEGDEFDFNMFEPDKPWYWQAELIDWWMSANVFLILKARQLGVTWCACALGLWYLLFRPGVAVEAYSYTEDESIKLIQKTWLMYQSLPPALRAHVTVVTPERAQEPTQWIKLKHTRSGKMSTFQALPATKKHGRGTSAGLIIMDEAAFQDYAQQIYTSANPSISKGGKLIVVSTANGVSNPETGEGNFFHHLYDTRIEKGLEFKFLPWNMHPGRDEKWYETVARRLGEVERNQEYPLNVEDAFMLSGALYFEREALEWYRGNVKEPLFRGQFTLKGRKKANFIPLKDGIISVYERPKADAKYAIGVDTASGKGADYTVGTVIDLGSGAIVASMRAKIEAPRTAFQLHFLGKWYNEALICVEKQGGNGEAVIIALRDGNQNIPSYKKLYRHKRFISSAKPMSEDYGHPMGAGNRVQVLNQLASDVRERRFPWMTHEHMGELGTFVYRDKIPSPAAQEGCHDDCVMSLALASEMFRQYGVHPDKPARGKGRMKRQSYKPGPAKAGGR